MYGYTVECKNVVPYPAFPEIPTRPRLFGLDSRALEQFCPYSPGLVWLYRPPSHWKRGHPSHSDHHGIKYVGQKAQNPRKPVLPRNGAEQLEGAFTRMGKGWQPLGSKSC